MLTIRLIVGDRCPSWVSPRRACALPRRAPGSVGLCDRPGTLYYLLDMCDGGEVWKRLTVGDNRVVGTFPTLARFWLAEVVSALEHMHGKGLVHRDLKVSKQDLGWRRFWRREEAFVFLCLRLVSGVQRCVFGTGA